MSTKVRPFADMSSRNTTDNSSMNKVFSALRVYLRLCGFYIECEGRRWSLPNCLMMTYCAFCCICALVNGTLLLIFMDQSKDSEQIWATVPYYIGGAETAAIFLTSVISLPNNFNKFVQQMEAKSKMYPNSCDYYARMKKVLYMSMVIMSFYYMIMVGGAIVATDSEFVRRFFIPYKQLNDSYPYLGTFLYGMMALFGCTSLNAIPILFNALSYCVYKEFALYSSKFKALFKGSPEVFEKEFQDLWDDFLSICDLLSTAQTFLKHYIAITYLSTMPIFCVLLYGLIRGQLTADELGVKSMILVVSVVQITNITFVGVLINNKVSGMSCSY